MSRRENHSASIEATVDVSRRSHGLETGVDGPQAHSQDTTYPSSASNQIIQIQRSGRGPKGATTHPLHHLNPSFLKKYNATTEYGKYLRKVEKAAYECSKLDRPLSPFQGDFGSEMERHNFESAQKKGIDRAQAERADETLTVDVSLQSSEEQQRLVENTPDIDPATSSNLERSTIPSKHGRGLFHSPTNPYYVPSDDGETPSKQKNFFFETMPAAEVWHRQRAAFLPFGETRFMQRVLSKEISDALSGGKSILFHMSSNGRY